MIKCSHPLKVRFRARSRQPTAVRSSCAPVQEAALASRLLGDFAPWREAHTIPSPRPQADSPSLFVASTRTLNAAAGGTKNNVAKNALRDKTRHDVKPDLAPETANTPAESANKTSWPPRHSRRL